MRYAVAAGSPGLAAHRPGTLGSQAGPTRAAAGPACAAGHQWPIPGSSALPRSRLPTKSGGPTERRAETTGSSGPTTPSGPPSIPPAGGSPGLRRSATPTTRPTRSDSCGCSWTRICSAPAAPAPCYSHRRVASAARASREDSRSTAWSSAACRQCGHLPDAAPRHGVQHPTRRPLGSVARLPRPGRHCGLGWTTR